jgi:hypothetical protein
MTRLTDDAESRRADCEGALGHLESCDSSLRMVEIRTRQAIQRTGLERLLGPVFAELDAIRANIARTREYLRAEWQAGNRTHWTLNTPEDTGTPTSDCGLRTSD